MVPAIVFGLRWPLDVRFRRTLALLSVGVTDLIDFVEVNEIRTCAQAVGALLASGSMRLR
jgi:hypothetical protein